MPNAHHYVPHPIVKRDTEALPRWEQEFVAELTERVAAMTKGTVQENELLQRAWARVDRRKLRRH